MQNRVVTGLWLLCSACTCPNSLVIEEPGEPPAATVAPVTAAPATTAPAVDPNAATVATTTAPAAAPALSGLAAQVCPPGPYAPSATGALTATALPNTEPTVLDPKDKVFHLYEGAVWLNGVLYFSDFKTSPGFPSRILSYTPEQGIKVWLADSGTNGLGLDKTGSQLAGARHKSKSVVLFSADGKTATDVVAKYEGKGFNSPNDLVFRADGNLYFTDPDFQSGNNKPQPTTNVYRVSPSGEVSVVDNTFKNPNGVSLSPDESALYVAGNGDQGYVKRYPLAADGSVGEGQVFVQPVTVPDGMAFDCAGNLYVTEHTARRVRVIAPDGKELAQITGMDKNVTNVAFGGAERKTLFITSTGGLYKLDLPIPGLPY